LAIPEKQLQEWEIHPGFYSILSVSVNNSTNINIINKTNIHLSPAPLRANLIVLIRKFFNGFINKSMIIIKDIGYI
jgi:hypothetical protein